MKQAAEHEITVRIRTRYPQEDWAALVSDALNSRSVAGKGRIVDVSSSKPTESMEQNVIRWAQERGIFDKATLETQFEKLEEEVGEIRLALTDDDQEGLVDGIGDASVVLTILAHMCGVTFDQCRQHAWQEIKDRKGQMIDGVFVKESA